VKLQRDLSEFVALLGVHEVDYLVVGAHAVAFHGYPRFTGDIDLLVRPTLDNGRRIIAALSSFGMGQVDLAAEDFAAPELIVQLGRPPNRIDLLTSITGVTFEAAWASRVRGELDEHQVWYPSKAVLIQNKRAAARPRDLADVAELVDS